MAVTTRTIKLSQLELNTGQIEGLPRNPRFIRDTKFKSLVKSIGDTPEMLELRELLVYPHGKKYVVIGGNMRLRACKEQGMTTVPCKVLDADTPLDKLCEIAIKDNVPSGEDDWDILANEWDTDKLTEWGMDLPDNWGQDEDDDQEEETGGDSETAQDDTEEEVRTVDAPPDILYPSNNWLEIPALLLEMQAGKVILPVAPWGANSRLRTGVATYHLYVDDYRFAKLWKDPQGIPNSGCAAVVEPNFSLHDQTPISWGLQAIYKKRWLARWWQDSGVQVYVDLYVAPKFAEYNLLGIPEGWDAFWTRGESYIEGRLEADLDIARKVSGKDMPNLTVYGGGAKIKEKCQKYGLLYIENLMTARHEKISK